MNYTNNINEDELMWNKYGFHIGYKESVEDNGLMIYFTKGLTYSRGINDFELKGNLDTETAKYIFVSILDRIDQGKEVKNGTTFVGILGMFTLEFINIQGSRTTKILIK